MSLESLITDLIQALNRQTEATDKNSALIELALSKSPAVEKRDVTPRAKKEKPAVAEPEPEPSPLVEENLVPSEAEDPDAVATEEELTPVKEAFRSGSAKATSKTAFSDKFKEIRDSFGVTQLVQLKKKDIPKLLELVGGIEA